jgi:23S rRNA pseudouridine1911/1915/1917 synthase
MADKPTDPVARFEQRVLYEDNHYIIVNKRPSEIVQGDKTGDVPLSDVVKEYIRVKYNKPGAAFLGVAHRIDRPVSGLVIFARTSKGLARINEMLRQHQLSKKYWAVVAEKPPETEGQLEHFLAKNEKQNKSYVCTEDAPRAKNALLKYRILGSSDRYYLLEVELLTGRHHQIRAQLAAIGCPIKGDLKYGFPRSNQDASIHLHARSLAFLHPVSKQRLEIVAPPPEGDPLWQYFGDQ